MRCQQQISNSDEIIDSRDVIARIDELTASRDAAIELGQDRTTDVWTGQDGTVFGDSPDWYEDTYNELKALESLQEDAKGYSPDWTYGATLINDGYFEQYAEQLAEDIGAIDRDAKWPLNHIDWEAAANELKSDYTSVDFDGTTYWVR